MVQLMPMTEGDYQHFITWAMDDYAQQQVTAGAWRPDQAVDLAAKAFAALLPEGMSTPNQFLTLVVREEDEEAIGYLWFGIREEGESRFVVLYDFLIFESYRRQGYGSAALKALEKTVCEQGIERVLLHVFGHNEGARALYQKMGYVERNVTMVKDVGKRTG